ncbi:MAG TPA: hypothetical protein VKW78_23330 [Terriglobales bacterium]|nr:hypothetical protein [Terriglobales bacterium]
MFEAARHDGARGEIPREDQYEAGAGEGVRNVAVSPALNPVDPDRELPEHGTPSELGEWPVTTTRPRTPQAADRLGQALGSAASQVRQIPINLKYRIEDLRERFKVIRGRASNDVREAAGDLQQGAARNLRQARSRAQRLAHDYPIEFVLGSAAAAFLVGFILGWWRQSNE